MQTLIRQTRDYCDSIVRTNEFFKCLDAGKLDNLTFIYQLRNWCGAFIDCLLMAAANTADPAFKKVRRKHAMEEGNHPDQLDRWMAAHGFNLPAPAMALEMRELTTFVRMVVTDGSAAEQVFILNVLLEYAALVTFQAMIKHFGREVLDGPYFHVHQEVDEIHSAMGTELISQSYIDEKRPHLEQLVEHGAYLLDRMLASLTR